MIAMADSQPRSSTMLADRAGLDERYVREWLGAMTTGRIVDHDPETGNFLLPGEHASFLSRESAADNIAVFAQYIPLLGSVEDDIVACFHDGGGVPYDRFPRFHEVMAEDSGQSVLSSLFDHILPLVPGLAPRAVAQVADDDVRLQAEGFIAGFQENLIDTVARGEILRSQIGRRIKDKNWDEAGELLEDFRVLPTRRDYVNQLLTQRQRFPSNVPAVQSKIDKQFSDTRKILQAYLAPERAGNLAA